MISPNPPGTYAEIAAWPLARTLAANDLIDALAAHQAATLERARAQAESRRG